MICGFLPNNIIIYYCCDLPGHTSFHSIPKTINKLLLFSVLTQRQNIKQKQQRQIKKENKITTNKINRTNEKESNTKKTKQKTTS